jgi:hypothetical protein
MLVRISGHETVARRRRFLRPSQARYLFPSDRRGRSLACARRLRALPRRYADGVFDQGQHGDAFPALTSFSPLVAAARKIAPVLRTASPYDGEATARRFAQRDTRDHLIRQIGKVGRLVLLDAETRAEFIDRAFREYFSLPDEKATASRPSSR